MNTSLSKPKHLISLASSAVIVTVEVNVWTATKQDRAISNEVTTAKRASADAGKFTQNLLANSPEHKALLNYRQTVYNWFTNRPIAPFYRGKVATLLEIMKDAQTAEQAWRKACSHFHLNP